MKRNMFGLYDAKYFEKAEKKGLLEEVTFLGQSVQGWDEFSKFLIVLDKELKSSKSIRHMIISSSIAVEHFIDLIFNRMYRLDTYKKFNYKDFLSGINFSQKIDYIRKLKKTYPKKRPINKEYQEHFQASISFLKELRKTPEGKKIQEEIENINESVNKKNGIEKPIPWYLSTSTRIAPYKKKDNDYLSEEIFLIIKKIDLSKLDRIRRMRNIVAHEWDFQTEIAKLLSVKHRKDLENTVRSFCLQTLDSIIKN